jgi:hypothetical protein
MGNRMAILTQFKFSIVFRVIFLSVCCANAGTTPYLILHFDMNRTLIATDAVGKKTGHDTICGAIADQMVDFWDDSFAAPLNYYEYVKYHLVPNPTNSKEIKLRQKEKIAEILDFLKEKDDRNYFRAKEIYVRAMDAFQKQETEIFPSFYKLIDKLHERNIAYTLIIRTFGSEAGSIAEELNQRYGENFIANAYAMKQGQLEGTESDLYALILNADHHFIIRDDWDWWYSHKENWMYGKPFPIDLNDKERISLFFDDHAKPNPNYPDSNIVTPYNVENGLLISPDKLIAAKSIYPVDMIEALCDEDYYVRFIEKFISE